ncbi:MAG TPA: DUF1800 domain-containing protein [Fimbriimonas sp.]|nr:DUF1800 domain-containing protein [Fimbriimonas sp.]
MRLATTGAVVGALGGCAPVAKRFADHPEALPLPAGDIEPEVRLLNRAGFGPRPGDVARLREQGHEAYLVEQLKAAQQEDLGLQMQIQHLDVGQIDDPDLEDLPKAEVVRQLQQAAILRAVYSRNQLLERTVDFWSNHFNVYAAKGDSTFRKGGEERDVIRANALGNFPDLLKSSASNAAILAFLDNPQNFKLHPNENYARELMELHTLGVGGGYTQKDVQEVARCFTGWVIENRMFHLNRGKVRFDPNLHDDGQKLVLGHVIPAGGGEKDVAAVLDILTNHPSTARFISTKLVRYFYGAADPALIDQTARTFTKTGGHVPSMIEPLLQPRVLANAPPKIKRPFDYLVSAIRATGGDTDGNNGIQGHLVTMGEPLYEWPMPDGYPVKTVAWATSMLPRWNFAHALAHDQIGGTSIGKVGEVFETVLNRRPKLDDRDLTDALSGQDKASALALCLASPSFQWC